MAGFKLLGQRYMWWLARVSPRRSIVNCWRKNPLKADWKDKGPDPYNSARYRRYLLIGSQKLARLPPHNSQFDQPCCRCTHSSEASCSPWSKIRRQKRKGHLWQCLPSLQKTWRSLHSRLFLLLRLKFLPNVSVVDHSHSKVAIDEQFCRNAVAFVSLSEK